MADDRSLRRAGSVTTIRFALDGLTEYTRERAAMGGHDIHGVYGAPD